MISESEYKMSSFDVPSPALQRRSKVNHFTDGGRRDIYHFLPDLVDRLGRRASIDRMFSRWIWRKTTHAIEYPFMWATLHLLDNAVALSLDDKRKFVDDLILLRLELAGEHNQVLLHGNVGILKDVLSQIVRTKGGVLRLLPTRTADFSFGCI